MCFLCSFASRNIENITVKSLRLKKQKQKGGFTLVEKLVYRERQSATRCDGNTLGASDWNIRYRFCFTEGMKNSDRWKHDFCWTHETNINAINVWGLIGAASCCCTIFSCSDAMAPDRRTWFIKRQKLVTLLTLNEPSLTNCTEIKDRKGTYIFLLATFGWKSD